MDFNISIFEDAARAVDKLTDTFAKLTRMIVAAIGSGHEIFEWNEARQTRKKLSKISGMALELNQSRCELLLSAVQDFVDHPNRQQAWESVKSVVAQTLNDIEDLLSELKLTEGQAVTAEFYAELSLTLRKRQRMLGRLIESPPPVSADEVNAIESFLVKYRELVDQLRAVLKALNKYIDMLKADGRWPIGNE
ncbi:hypothetical protein ACVI1L_004433 [Bradyrhizobium sp. USDA 4516]